MAPPLVEVVAATRLSEAAFAASALGQSLKRLGDTVAARIAFDNARGLPEVYNAAIESANGPDCLAFVHDDVWLDEEHFAERIAEGLDAFDVIGVAGNRRVFPGQTSWLLVDGRWDGLEHLSGRAGHGQEAHGEVSEFGPVPAPCRLLDGVFLAACKSTLHSAGVRFDARFRFHYYDLDFCRTASSRGLSLGTWNIALTHQSVGHFAGAEWAAAQQHYLAKWQGRG